MQRVVVAALLALVLSTPAGVADVRLRFNTPGGFAAAGSSVLDGEWAVLVFDDTAASFDFHFDAEGSIENRTWVYPVRAYNHSSDISPYGFPLTSSRAVPAGAEFHIQMPSAGRASLVIEADHIRLDTEAITGQLAEKPANFGASDFVRERDKVDHVHRYISPAGDHAVIQYQSLPTTSFVLAVSGARHVEWHGATVQCAQTDWCPDGGRSTAKTVSVPTSMNLSSQQYSYEIATEGVHEVRGSGALEYAVLGGTRLTFAIDDGRIRLPLARTQGPCPRCSFPENQTLTLGGDITLASLARSGDSQLDADLGGSLMEARVDEQSVDPRILMGVGTAAGVAVVAIGLVVLKVLGLLFTKWQDRDLLDQPRRRQVYEAIAEHPGTSFRELTRLTGLAIGTVRHHLDVLLRHGKIVERPQGATLRFFENHGKYDRTWNRVATLRDEHLRAVHGWLADHPDTAQNDVLTALEREGYSRTATQRRLQRLVTAKLASVQQRGRFKIYRAA